MASCSTAEGIVAKADLVLYFQQGSASQLAPDLRAKRRKTNLSRANQMITRHSPNLHAIPWISLYCYSYNIIIIKATQRATCIYTENSCKERGQRMVGGKIMVASKITAYYSPTCKQNIYLKCKKMFKRFQFWNASSRFNLQIKKKKKKIKNHLFPSLPLLSDFDQRLLLTVLPNIGQSVLHEGSS